MKEIFNETFAFCAMIQQYDSPFHKLYSFSVDHHEKNSKSQTTPSNWFRRLVAFSLINQSLSEMWKIKYSISI